MQAIFHERNSIEHVTGAVCKLSKCETIKTVWTAINELSDGVTRCERFFFNACSASALDMEVQQVLEAIKYLNIKTIFMPTNDDGRNMRDPEEATWRVMLLDVCVWRFEGVSPRAIGSECGDTVFTEFEGGNWVEDRTFMLIGPYFQTPNKIFSNFSFLSIILHFYSF